MEAIKRLEKTNNSSWFLIGLILLNAVPLYGVFAWGWQSFDLIFLYWLENVMIGASCVLRFVIRRYDHAAELALPFFFAPFFTFHYGMFCFVHGTFVLALFGEPVLGDISKQDLPGVITTILDLRNLWPAAIALALLQLLDWIRDTSERGLGGDNIKELMVAPYRRITVLHIAIIVSGFALAGMNEPTFGLVALVILKVSFDAYHWRKDEKRDSGSEPFELDVKTKKHIDQMLAEPKITVNGKDVHFENFEALRQSKHYRLMKAVMRLFGQGKHLAEMEHYAEKRWQEIEDEKRFQAAKPIDVDASKAV